MSDRPDPPMEIAQYILDGLDRQSPEKLRTIATYAEDLAAWRDQSANMGRPPRTNPMAKTSLTVSMRTTD